MPDAGATPELAANAPGAALTDGVQRIADARGSFLLFVARPEALEIFWRDDSGQDFTSVERLSHALQSRGSQLVFATNGGIYEVSGAPKGLYIENGVQLVKLDKHRGRGNFYMQPNGVFAIDRAQHARLVTTGEYSQLDAAARASLRLATQSGPMLVLEGAINARFDPASSSINRRVGVGVLRDGRVLLAIAQWPVNFFHFAEVFKDAGCERALYLDGGPPGVMYTPRAQVAALGRLGPIIAIRGAHP